MAYQRPRAVFAWAIYDWANSAYTTTIMAGFFPVFFKQFWASGLSVNESTFWLGLANAVAGLAIALAAPAMGAIADQGGLKKRLMLCFTYLGVLMTAALFFVAAGQWLVAVLVYLFGAIAFSGANVFYDALIVDVAETNELDRASSLGYGLGYLGGGLLFLLNVVMTLHPDWFALESREQAVRWSFVSVALWWAIFTLPVFCWVEEAEGRERLPIGMATRQGIRQLIQTFHHVRNRRQIWLFLLAYFFYIDGVNTVARMAVDYGMALGFEASVLLSALLITQFVGFPAAIAVGWLGDRLGCKRVLLVCIGIYAGVCIWSGRMQDVSDFYWLAAVIGLVIGGIQALSRSMYARLIPKAQSGEYFGFFNMLGKFATVFGPLLMGAVSLASGSARLSILALVLLFALGGLMLYFVREKEGNHG